MLIKKQKKQKKSKKNQLSIPIIVSSRKYGLANRKRTGGVVVEAIEGKPTAKWNTFLRKLRGSNAAANTTELQMDALEPKPFSLQEYTKDVLEKEKNSPDQSYFPTVEKETTFAVTTPQEKEIQGYNEWKEGKSFEENYANIFDPKKIKYSELKDFSKTPEQIRMEALKQINDNTKISTGVIGRQGHLKGPDVVKAPIPKTNSKEDIDLAWDRYATTQNTDLAWDGNKYEEETSFINKPIVLNMTPKSKPINTSRYLRGGPKKSNLPKYSLSRPPTELELLERIANRPQPIQPYNRLRELVKQRRYRKGDLNELAYAQASKRRYNRK